jgi:hypothetical protein
MEPDPRAQYARIGRELATVIAPYPESEDAWVEVGAEAVQAVDMVMGGERACRKDGHRYHELSDTDPIRLYCRRCGVIRVARMPNADG